MAFLNRDFPAKHPFSRLTVSPDMPGCPEVWLLGSSLWSAAAAAKFGVRYAFAHFIDSNPTRSAMEHYFSHFTPSRELPRRTRWFRRACSAPTRRPRPRACSAARAFFAAAFDRATCVRFRRPRMRSRSSARRRKPPSSELGEWPRYFAGTPERVRDQLIDMASVLHVDELMIVTIAHDHRARMRSYQLLAEAFNLTPRSA